MEEKEYYKQKIIENINKIEESEILQYIYIIIKDIIIEKEIK